MMKATDLRERDHVAHLGRLDRARHGTVVVQRPVSARVMVVGDVAAENWAEMLLVEDQEMVEALSTNGADQTFAIRILPGRVGRSLDLFDADRLDASGELPEELRVVVAEQVARGGVLGKRLEELSSGPGAGRRVGHADSLASLRGGQPGS